MLGPKGLSDIPSLKSGQELVLLRHWELGVLNPGIYVNSTDTLTNLVILHCDCEYTL